MFCNKLYSVNMSPVLSFMFMDTLKSCREINAMVHFSNLNGCTHHKSVNVM